MIRNKKTCWLATTLFVSMGLQVAPVYALKKNAKKPNAEDAQLLTPAVVDGYPALRFSADGWSTSVALTEFKDEPAFMLPLRRENGGDGYLYITATRIAWSPEFGTERADQSLEVSRGGAVNKGEHGRRCSFVINDKPDSFVALFQRGQERNVIPKGIRKDNVISGWINSIFSHWCTEPLVNFAVAEKEYRHDVGETIWANSPEVKAQRKAVRQAFEQKVAVWRANGSKVDPPEEAQRHFAIAQAAFQDKNFHHQAEELSSALEVYPTWSAEQYDLAVILGELNRYSEAAEHMQMYLELTPDAPDAEKAKQQIWIWQDKIAQSLSK